MKKIFSLAVSAFIALSFSNCTPEILSLIPETGKGSYEVELPILPPGTLPYSDCSGTPLILTSGNLKAEYNVVKNSNVVNGSLKVVVKDLKFVSTDGTLNYKGSFNSTLTARANNGEVLNFQAKFKIEAEGAGCVNGRHNDKETEASIQFKAILNPDGTLTVTNSQVKIECE